MAIRYRRNLRDTAGHAAHAATYIRRRLVYLDTELKNDPEERERILLLELFHLVWTRLGNQSRRGWEALLSAELRSRARGEAGWSAEWRKDRLTAHDVDARSRRWREYCCESFCDTAAFVVGGHGGEVTLSRRRLAARAAWFRASLGAGPFPI